VKQVFDRPSATPSAIVIVGSGVVGTATGEGFLELGHDVTFVDISERRVQALRERGLNASTTVDLPADRSAFIILTLPTPHVGHAYDLTAFTEGTAAVGRALATSAPVHTVVVRSTVPPGTSDELVRPALERESGKTVGTGFELASNPEFLRAATAVEDFRNPWMTVIASRHPQTIARMRELLAPFGGEVRTFNEPASAELVKCAHNIYNATKISFWNEMWLVAQAYGIDADPVASTVAASSEGSINPLYGIRGGAPYGGVCLPKDTCGFLGFAGSIGVDMPLLRAVVEVNDRMEALTGQELDSVVERDMSGADVA
jgi:UDPglucose 6-dehydrogenase